MSMPMIAGNWKMNATIEKARSMVRRMRAGLEAIEGAEKVLFPPFTALSTVRDLLRGSSIALGAQDVFSERSGAYTGEVSPRMVAELCTFVIVGHSERRQLFGEGDLYVNKKVKAALKVGLRPILCLGEDLVDREEGLAEVIVGQQVRLCLQRVKMIDSLVVAYEPVWAIGTGRAATPEDAQAMMAHLRRLLAARYGDDAASRVPLLYGGSVTAENVGDFVREKDVDGALVGGASLKPESFVELVANAAEAAAA